MKKILTIKEFLPKNSNGMYSRNEVEKAMTEFAKMHVEAALEAASVTVIFWEKFSYKHRAEHDKDSILNSYPLENIK